MATVDANEGGGGQVTILPPALSLMAPPIGREPGEIRQWFDAVSNVIMPTLDGSLEAERDAASAFQRLAKAENTRRAYRAAVAAWCAWCAHRNLAPLPASGLDVAAFLAAERLRGLKANTLDLRRAGIRYLHRVAGCAVPTDDACVSETIAGIRRDAAGKGEMPRKKAAATAVVIEQFLASIPDDLRGLRDRALILVGFAGALRRSELVTIQMHHLEASEKGIRLALPQTKGSQTEAVIVPLPYGRKGLCPVRALERWLAAAQITDGPVFRRIWLPKSSAPDEAPALPPIGHETLTTQAVANIIKARATAAGFNAKNFGGHSLKRGALTTGMENHVHPADLKRMGRHKSFDVLGEYLEFGDLFDRHPLSKVL
jgi:site-specific recombinase XerD